MDSDLYFGDKNYISAGRAAQISGYSVDYIGQLCRAKKLECKMIGRNWFVSEISLVEYQNSFSFSNPNVISETTSNIHNDKIGNDESISSSRDEKNTVNEKGELVYLEDKRPLIPNIISKKATTPIIIDATKIVRESERGKDIVNPQSANKLKSPTHKNAEHSFRGLLQKGALLAVFILIIFGVAAMKDFSLVGDARGRLASLPANFLKAIVISSKPDESLNFENKDENKILALIKKTPLYFEAGLRSSIDGAATVYHSLASKFEISDDSLNFAAVQEEKNGSSIYNIKRSTLGVVYKAESAFSSVGAEILQFSGLARKKASLFLDNTKFALGERYFDLKYLSAVAEISLKNKSISSINDFSLKIYSEANNLFSGIKNYFAGFFVNNNKFANKVIIPIKQSENLVTSYKIANSSSAGNTSQNAATQSPRPIINAKSKTTDQRENDFVVASDITRREVLDLIKQFDDNSKALIYAANAITGENSLIVNQTVSDLKNKIYSLEQKGSLVPRQVDRVYNTIGRSFSDISSLDGVTMTNSSFSGTTGTFTGVFSGASGTFSSSLTVGSQLTVSGAATSTLAGDTNFDSGTLYVDSINNRVGIASSSPSDTLSLNGPFYFAPISAPSVTTDRLYNISNNLYWAGNLVGSASVGNWTLASGNVYRASGSVGIGTTSPYAKLSVEGSSVLGNSALAGYFTATSTTATSTFPYLSATTAFRLGSDYLTDITGTNLSITDGVLSAAGSASDWVKETNYGVLTLTASTTIPYWAKSAIYASSTLTVANNVTFNSLGQGWLHTAGGNSTLTSSTSPTVAYLTATSTTATSTFAGGLAISGRATIGSNYVVKGATKIVCASNSADTSQCDYVADGTNDDVEINAAIAAIPSTGGLVQLMDGTYTIGSTINMNKSSTTFAGVGANTIIKVANSTQINAITLSGTNGIRITNMAIDGNKANQTDGGSNASQNGIWNSIPISNITIDNLWVANNKKNGFTAGGGRIDNGKITNNHFTNNDLNGIFGGDSGFGFVDTLISNNVIKSNIGAGIRFSNDSGYRVVIDSNVIMDNTGSGIDGFCSPTRSVISNNILVNDPINISCTDYVDIIGNAVTDSYISINNSGTGGGVVGPYIVMGNIVNALAGSSSHGIDISGIKNSIISNNVIAKSSGASGYAINISSNSTGITLAGNRYDNWVGAGFVDDQGTDTRYIQDDKLIIRGSAVVGTTTAPWARLSIQNNYGSSTPLFDIASSTSASYATSSLFRVNADGNIGIGTTSPYAKLSVEGSSALGNSALAGYFTATSTTATSTFAGKFAVGTSTPGASSLLTIGTSTPLLHIDNNSGFVGIGTTGPLSKFHIHNGASGNIATFISDGTVINEYAGLTLSSNSAGSDIWYASEIRSINTAGTPSFLNPRLGFFTQNTDTYLSAGRTEKVSILGNGNVGIGTTSPSTKLSVGGAAGDTTGHGYFTGGLGVGILNTAANTFRVGQCVTGDTKLRRRRRRKTRTKASHLDGQAKSQTDDNYVYDEVAIKDIKEGDEIASLDEKTDKIIWSKVKRVAYMGKKQTFKLTTEDGRQIRATANHPHLAKRGWTKVSNLRAGMPIAVPKERSRQKPRVGVFIDGANAFYSQRRAKWNIDYAKLRQYFESNFDVQFMNYYTALPKETDEPARSKTLKYLEKIGKNVCVITKPLKYINIRQKFDNGKLIIEGVDRKGDCDVDITVDVLNKLDELDVITIVSGDSDFVALRDNVLRKGKKIMFIAHKENLSVELKRGKYLTLGNIKDYIKRGQNEKTPALREGTLISLLYSNSKIVSRAPVDNSIKWVKIRSIEPIAEEDVYDVEIENTHNFIGNDIVAHNTAFMVDSSGNVGIGTTSPYAKLSVEGSSALGNSALAGYFTATSTVATSTFAGGLAVETSGLVYDFTSNNVGIGLANPAYKLEVQGSASTTNLYLPASSATAGVIYSGTNRYIHNFGTNNFFAGVNAGNLTMTGGGNFGIGINALTANTTGSNNTAVGMGALSSNIDGFLNVAVGPALGANISGIQNTAVGMGALSSNNNAYNTAVGYNSLTSNTTGNSNTAVGQAALASNTTGNSNTAFGISAGDNITTGSNNLIIGYNIDAPLATASNQMSIGNLIYSAGVNGAGTGFAPGNVGISSSTPWAKLSVHGLATDTDASKPLFLVASSTATATTTHFIVTNTGNVGIGRVAPAYPLDVLGAGTGAIIARFNDVNTTGCTLATGGTISCSSDITLKKNIEEISGGLDKVLGLRPILFNWKSEDDSSSDLKNLGFIAQEVEPILPKLVSTEENGIKQLNTIGMVPVLTKAIQELNLKVEDLKANNSQFSISNFQSISNDSIPNDNIISQLFNQFLEQFKNIGIVISNGAIAAREFIADKIIAKKVMTEAFEMKDSATGESYCVKITNGEWNKVKGACESSASSVSSSVSLSSSSSLISSGGTGGGRSQEESSSSQSLFQSSLGATAGQASSSSPSVENSNSSQSSSLSSSLNSSSESDSDSSSSSSSNEAISSSSSSSENSSSAISSFSSSETASSSSSEASSSSETSSAPAL